MTPDAVGDLTVTVAADAAQDAAGNTGPAAPVSQTAVFSTTGISITGPEGPLTTAGPFEIRITYWGIPGSGPGAGNLSYRYTNSRVTGEPTRGEGDVQTVALTPVSPSYRDQSGRTEKYSVRVNITWRDGESLVEAAWAVEVDPDPPTVSISGPTEPQSRPFAVTIEFSENVTGFEAADIPVTNATASLNSVAEDYYVLTVTPAASGPVTADVPAGVVHDEAGHPNEAAPQYSVPADLTLNDPPQLPGDGLVREIPENSPAGSPVGDPVAAENPGGDSLTYSMSGSAAFVIDPATGQISVAEGTVLDYETTQSYTVTVSVTDGRDAEGNTDPIIDDTVEVTITVLDFDLESPAPPDAPVVTRSSTHPKTALDVTWTASDNTGRPPLIGYHVEYLDKVGGKGIWKRLSFDITTTETTISGLKPGTTYKVFVRANNRAEESAGYGDASDVTTASTAANIDARFPGDGPVCEVAENSLTGSPVCAPVTAEDAEGDPLTYSLSGPHVFVIVPATGQIIVAEGAALDYETTPSYTVTVGVTDGWDTDGHADYSADDTVEVTINLTDVAPPGKPDAPAVAGTSSTGVEVSWTAPANTGPPIGSYLVHYRVPAGPEWDPATATGRLVFAPDTRTILTSLAPGTTYEVRVAAANSEGPGPLVGPGHGSHQSG